MGIEGQNMDGIGIVQKHPTDTATAATHQYHGLDLDSAEGRRVGNVQECVEHVEGRGPIALSGTLRNALRHDVVKDGVDR
jgi:hypothetical protein